MSYRWTFLGKIALCIGAVFLSIQLQARVPAISFIKTADGIIVYPNTSLSGNTRLTRLQVIKENIIRVTASPYQELKARNSLIVLHNEPLTSGWEVSETPGKIVLKTRLLIATTDRETGAVSFTDDKGIPIVAEKAALGRAFEPAVFEGERLYGIRQTFVTAPGDALYGLGQHQDDVFNYANQQVNLFQNNTEVAVPFLLSNKNYGILWDNYSITTVGDSRSFMPLSALGLYSKNGDRGWLTATYNNSRTESGKPLMEKAESTIDYAYLTASKLHLPEAFNPQKGVVTWQGAFASELEGVHTFRFTYAGYMKVWINGTMQLDRWRQPWNPGSAVLQLPLQKGKKYALTIEWIPDGGESYLSVKWQEPVAQADQHHFSFVSEAGQQLDYYFIYGANLDEVIAGYRGLTGKATLLPKWAFGFWQSRERYKTQEEILSTVSEFRKRKIPLDNIVQDWSYWKENDWGSQEFDRTRFPNPDSMISVLHNQYKANFMISVWPKFYEGIPAYEVFNKNGWLYKRNVADQQRDWIGKGYVSTFYDAFNPDARKGFWELLNKKLYSKGVDAWWMDASEPDILSNVSPEKRKEQMSPTALGTAAEYLNAYPMENAKGIYEGQRSTNPDKRVFILTRSAFAGSQQYAAATWSGDIAARWEDMKAQITAGLNFSLSGIPYWTMDIGGFAVEKRYEHAKGKDLEEWREQATRWYQFGAFCPLFRVHGQFPYREMYNTAPESHPAYQSMLYYDRLRYRLMPYIYSLAGAVYQEDYTMMRALVMDFPADSAVKTISDQYLFGPSLLVNPVYTYQARSRKLHLPDGQGWYDFYSGKYHSGGQDIQAVATYDRIPLYVKEGAIVPFGPALQYTAEKKADTLTVFVYTGKDASFKLYEDEDTNYGYEKGHYAYIPLRYHHASGTLTIGKREGSFPGMLTQRVFNIVWVTREKPAGWSPDKSPDATLLYKGEQLNVEMK